jgi:iron(III) transport system substrate-binding protein
MIALTSRRRRPARAGVLALAGALLLGLAACGDDSSGRSEPNDGTITVYSGRGESLVGPVIDQFQEATGITVRVRYGNTAQMAAQLQEEGDRSPADIFYAQDAGALGAVAKSGLFATLPDDVLNRVPVAFQAHSGEWVGVTGRSRVLIYHPDRVEESELPASVFELTEPQWRGRVGVAPTNASFQAFVTGMWVVHGEEATREWLAGIAANDPQIRENNTAIVADVNDGRIDAGLVNHYYLYERAKEEGVTVDQLDARHHYFPDGDIGALVNVSGVGVLSHAADDEDVRAFLDYLLSEAGQRYFAEQTSEYPMIDGIDVVPGLPRLSELSTPSDLDLNDLDSLQETIAMISDSGLAP